MGNMCLHKNEVIFILMFFSQKCLSTSKLYWYQDIQLDKNNTWARTLSFHQYFLEMEYFSYFPAKAFMKEFHIVQFASLKLFVLKIQNENLLVNIFVTLLNKVSEVTTITFVAVSKHFIGNHQVILANSNILHSFVISLHALQFFVIDAF